MPDILSESVLFETVSADDAVKKVKYGSYTFCYMYHSQKGLAHFMKCLGEKKVRS